VERLSGGSQQPTFRFLRRLKRVRDFPVRRAWTYLESGPVFQVTPCQEDERNVMTMGWHIVLE